MEIEIFQMLKLSFCRRKQFFTEPHIGIHGSANIKEDQYLDRIAAFGNHFDIQHARIARSTANRIVEI